MILKNKYLDYVWVCLMHLIKKLKLNRDIFWEDKNESFLREFRTNILTFKSLLTLRKFNKYM